MESESKIHLRPIGYVNNGFKDNVPDGYENKASEIIINPDLEEGLFLINENSHILVVFFMDRVTPEEKPPLKIHPKGRKDLPLVGVFATRSSQRPNPIGIRAVRLIEIKGNKLFVEGLDALSGTPVLDIKPYSKKHDNVEGSIAPSWVKHLGDTGR